MPPVGRANKVQIVDEGGNIVSVAGGVLRTVAAAQEPENFAADKVMLVGSDGSVAGVTGGALDTSGG